MGEPKRVLICRCGARVDRDTLPEAVRWRRRVLCRDCFREAREARERRYSERRGLPELEGGSAEQKAFARALRMRWLERLRDECGMRQRPVEDQRLADRLADELETVTRTLFFVASSNRTREEMWRRVFGRVVPKSVPGEASEPVSAGAVGRAFATGETVTMAARLAEQEVERLADPTTWEMVETEALAHHRASPSSEMLLDLARWSSIAARAGIERSDRLAWVVRMAGIAPWRYSKCVLRVNAADLNDVVAEPLRAPLPMHMLEDLPGHSTFLALELDGDSATLMEAANGRRVVGAWVAYLDLPVSALSDSGIPIFGPSECGEFALGAIVSALDERGGVGSVLLPSVVASFERLVAHTPPSCKSWTTENEAMLERVLSALIFAAGELGEEPPPATSSTRPAGVDQPARGEIVSRRDSGAGRANDGLTVPARTKVIDVESRWPQGEQDRRRLGMTSQRVGGGTAPPGAHVRGAHWHTFVYGPRDEPSLQRRRARWVRRTLVGA